MEQKKKKCIENDTISREGLLWFLHRRPVTKLWLIEKLLSCLSTAGNNNKKGPMKANIVFDSKGHLLVFEQSVPKEVF